MSYLHGMTMNMYLADDPNHYYTGMFNVSSLKADARTNGVTINYDLYPFRRSLQRSDEEWLWDPFNFETGYAQNMSALVVDTQLVVEITDCVEPVSPGITPTVAMTLMHGYVSPSGTASVNSYNLSANTTFSSLTLRQGTNRLVFNSSTAGTVHISYRGGTL